MQLSAFVTTALLLFIPALVGAAPTEAENALFARQDGQTCNPPQPNRNDPAAVKKYNDLTAKMAAATRAAHTGQSSCPATQVTAFNQSKDQAKRTQIKNTCVAGYQACVTQRKAANKACTQLGGTVDQGHLTAVQVCQTQLTSWKARKP